MTVTKAARKTIKKKASTSKLSPSAMLAKKIFMIAIFLLSQVLFCCSDFFKLTEIKIYGNHHISESEILQTANIPLGQNIIILPRNAFRQRLDSIHWIRDVKIRWSLPGRVSIFIQERTPMAVIRQNGKPSSWYLVDEDGAVLRQASEKEKKKFPPLVVEKNIVVGQFVSPEPVKSVKTLDSLIPPNIKENMQYYLADEVGEIIIHTTRMGKPLKIKVGKIENVNRKMEVLGAFLELIDEKKTQVQYIDLRFNQPVLKLYEENKLGKNGAQTGSDEKH